jgi:hypothetical protein
MTPRPPTGGTTTASNGTSPAASRRKSAKGRHGKGVAGMQQVLEESAEE